MVCAKVRPGDCSSTRRKQGATHAELCEAVGRKQCLPFLIKSAKQAKVTLRKEREGREVRYFGTASASRTNGRTPCGH